MDTRNHEHYKDKTAHDAIRAVVCCIKGLRKETRRQLEME